MQIQNEDGASSIPFVVRGVSADAARAGLNRAMVLGREDRGNPLPVTRRNAA